MMSTILIVDDNPINLKLLRRTLEDADYKVLLAENGEQALETAITRTPDLILLDIVMPGMDGFEVCRRLKSIDATENIPVIFLTAKNDSIDKVRGLTIGAVDYITKPFDPVEVIARANTHIRLKNLHQQLLQKNIQLEKAYGDLHKKTELINKDIKAAGMVQRQLLPQNISSIGKLHFAWQFVPSSHVAGDIFNVLRPDKKHVALFMVDVSGHGVQSAMLAVSIHNFFRSGLNTAHPPERLGKNNPLHYLLEPEKVMRELNTNFPMDTFDAYFTCIYMVIDLDTCQVRLVNAGHPYPLLISSNGKSKYIEHADIPVGMMEYAAFSEIKFDLQSGDELILLTDGLFEVPVENKQQIGLETVTEMLTEQNGSLNQRFTKTIKRVRSLSTAKEFSDDVSLFGFEVQ